MPLTEAVADSVGQLPLGGLSHTSTAFTPAKRLMPRDNSPPARLASGLEQALAMATNSKA